MGWCGVFSRPGQSSSRDSDCSRASPRGREDQGVCRRSLPRLSATRWSDGSFRIRSSTCNGFRCSWLLLVATLSSRGPFRRLSGFSAVAMWLPPGAEPDGDAIVGVLSEGVSTDKHTDVFAVLEQMDVAHPQTPHWYLPWLGVDCALHARGLGGELLAHGLQTVDSSHLPAYLETPNPRSVPFYERHGFSVSGTAQAGDCAPADIDVARSALSGAKPTLPRPCVVARVGESVCV